MQRSGLIDRFYKEVKRKGMFARKDAVELSVYPDRIEGYGFKMYDGDLSYSQFTVPHRDIREIGKSIADGKGWFSFTYTNTKSVQSNSTVTIVMIGMDDPDKWKAVIEKAKAEDERQATEKQKKEQEEREKQELAIKQAEQEKATFYQKCVEFHIKPTTPVYTFSSDTNELTAMYIAADKSINFLFVNGNTAEESVGTIPYDKIHYFEKAGNISYATDIHGSYSSFGGSMTGGKFSKTASAIGGALFGIMGMSAGALLTHKPAKQEPIKTDFKLDSEIVKIDDRSVILNFFSDERKQYIDIELPQDMYNFLQTHLPDKKFGVVEELEKHAALQKAKEQNAIPSASNPTQLPESAATNNQDNVDSLEAFKRKVEKLKIMKEAGLLTIDEFEEEKRKLIASL